MPHVFTKPVKLQPLLLGQLHVPEDEEMGIHLPEETRLLGRHIGRVAGGYEDEYEKLGLGARKERVGKRRLIYTPAGTFLPTTEVPIKAVNVFGARKKRQKMRKEKIATDKARMLSIQRGLLKGEPFIAILSKDPVTITKIFAAAKKAGRGLVVLKYGKLQSVRGQVGVRAYATLPPAEAPARPTERIVAPPTEYIMPSTPGY